MQTFLLDINVSDDECDQVPIREVHPFDLVKMKQGQMDQFKSNFSKVNDDLHSNERMKIFRQQYDNLKSQLIMQQQEESQYKNPETFQSIFDEDDTEQEDQKLFYLKQRYFNECIRDYQESSESDLSVVQIDINPLDNIKFDYNKIVQNLNEQYNDSIKETQIKIQNLFNENQQLLSKAKSRFPCKNTQILQKISPLILNCYEVYFPEIFDALIDDLLEDEVNFLNEIEKINQTSKQHLKINQKQSDLTITLALLEQYIQE